MIFWYVAQCQWVVCYQHFKTACCSHFQDLRCPRRMLLGGCDKPDDVALGCLVVLIWGHFVDILTLDDGTDILSWIVGNTLPIEVVQHPRWLQASDFSHASAYTLLGFYNPSWMALELLCYFLIIISLQWPVRGYFQWLQLMCKMRKKRQSLCHDSSCRLWHQQTQDIND